MSDGEISCPKCFNKNPPGAAFCGHCGADMRAKGAPEGDAMKSTMFGYQANLDAEGLAAAPAAEPSPAAAPPAAAATAAPAAAAPAAPATVGEHFSLVPQGHPLPTGTLHPGQDTRDGSQVAVLLVAPEVFPSPLDMERARRELRQLQKIESPNLVKVLDQGKSSDERLYVVMEPVQGQSLVDLLAADGPMALPAAQRIIRGVGVGLSEAQRLGVIHRDIAPHNVLVASDGTVKVLGFGIAAPIKRNVFGTAEYISPEQAAGRPVDQRSNIYSLGALMFYMLTGEPPFTGEAESVLEQHQSAEPPSPTDRRPELELSPRAAQLVAKALAKSSSRRHLTLRQFLREVEGLDGADSGQAQARGQTPTFETPLHGVTSLSGGERPPSSEYVPAVDPKAQIAPDAAAVTLPDTGSVELDPSSSRSAVGAAAGAAIAGEMAGGARVALKQTDETPAIKKPDSMTKPDSGADVGGAASGGGGAGKGAFRETMWFAKGELESAMAESGEAAEGAGELDGVDLQDKYRDDGSLDEEAKKLSLRTGNTQMMKAVSIPSGALPGEKMNEGEFISEMNRGRKIGIWLGIGFMVLASVGVALYLVFR